MNNIILLDLFFITDLHNNSNWPTVKEATEGNNLFADLSNLERPNDASRHTDGRLPAGRSTTQFLQKYHLECRGHGSGRRFSAGGNGPVRPRSVRNLPILINYIINREGARFNVNLDTISKVKYSC